MKASKQLKRRVRNKEFKDKMGSAYEHSAQKLYRSANSKKVTKISRAVLVVIMCLCLLFCIFNINYLSPSKMKEHMGAVFADMGKGEGYPFRFSSNEILDFFSFGSSDKVFITHSELIILNKSASPVLTYHHSMSNPIASYSKDRILLFDQGGTKAVILNQSGQVLSFPIDGKIITGTLSESGKCALAVQLSAQKQEITVYSYRGKSIMKWDKGSGYITNLALNNGGSLLSVALLDTVDAVKTTNLLCFNTSSAKQKSHVELKDSLIYSMRYINGSEIAVMTNRKISIFNSKSVCVHEADLPAVTNRSLAVSSDAHIINAYSLYNNGTYTVDVYNSSLKKVFSKNYKGEVKKALFSGGSVLVVFEDNRVEIDALNAKRTFAVQLDYDTDFVLLGGKYVYFCSNGIVGKVKTEKK